MTTKELSVLFPGRILDYPYPKPWPSEHPDVSKIKAIVLGCDPSNFSKNGETQVLETVFGIEGKGKDRRYFSGILQNLSQLGLTLTDLYVQNLCRNYFTKVTAENDCFAEAAIRWREYLCRELDELKILRNIPVFLTSQYIYKALKKEGVHEYTPAELYATRGLLPIPAEDNYLSRPLFPLYRGGFGAYQPNKKPVYKETVLTYLSNS